MQEAQIVVLWSLVRQTEAQMIRFALLRLTVFLSALVALLGALFAVQPLAALDPVAGAALTGLLVTLPAAYILSRSDG